LNDYLISVPHTYYYLEGPSVEHRFNQRPGRFSNASQRRAPIGGWVKKFFKADIEYAFEHGEVINYTLDGVSIYPVTTKIQASFLTQLTGRKLLSDFIIRPMVTLKQLQSLMAVIG
jgi:hypothetical protein